MFRRGLKKQQINRGLYRGYQAVSQDVMNKNSSPETFKMLWIQTYRTSTFMFAQMRLSFAVIGLIVNTRTVFKNNIKHEKKRTKPSREHQHSTVCGAYHNSAKQQSYHI